MSSTIIIPKHLARCFRTSQIDVEASDLKGALETLARDYRLDGVLLTSEGHLQPYLRVTVDEELVPSGKSGDLASVSVAGRTVRIMTAFAGG